MLEITPITTYQTIPIYLKRPNNKGNWLQWIYDGVQYGVPVTTLNESLSKAEQIIDATLALATTAESA